MGRAQTFSGNDTTTWWLLSSHHFDPSEWSGSVTATLRVQGYVTGSGTATFRIVRQTDDVVVALTTTVTLSGSFNTSSSLITTLPGSAQDWYIEMQFSGPLLADTVTVTNAELIYTN